MVLISIFENILKKMWGNVGDLVHLYRNFKNKVF